MEGRVRNAILKFDSPSIEVRRCYTLKPSKRDNSLPEVINITPSDGRIILLITELNKKQILIDALFPTLRKYFFLDTSCPYKPWIRDIGIHPKFGFLLLYHLEYDILWDDQ